MRTVVLVLRVPVEAAVVPVVVFSAARFGAAGFVGGDCEPVF